MMGTYSDQYYRIKRLLKICTDQYALNGQSGIPFDADEKKQNQILDSFLNLFLALYHLKDWITNDSSLGKQIQLASEPYVENSPDLKLLGDTANAVKHLVIKRYRVSKDTDLSVQSVLNGPIGSFPIGGFYGYSINIKTGGAGLDVEALQFAKRCLSEWETFFGQYHLSP